MIFKNGLSALVAFSDEAKVIALLLVVVVLRNRNSISSKNNLFCMDAIPSALNTNVFVPVVEIAWSGADLCELK